MLKRILKHMFYKIKYEKYNANKHYVETLCYKKQFNFSFRDFFSYYFFSLSILFFMFPLGYEIVELFR